MHNRDSEIDITKGEVLIYRTEGGEIKLEVQLVNETLWMTQSNMAQLFNCSTDNISLHLKNIYQEGELNELSTSEHFSVVRIEGNREVTRKLKFYNLDAIISVGYRVKSIVATRFRIWATKQLKEYLIKGFILNDERLKNPPVKDSLVPDYFDEMLERIRDIRSSERRMYLRVKEIFSMATDYEPSWPQTTKFFSIIQNKLHFAATGMTAAELIESRANHKLSNMGLTSWKGEVVRKTDVIIAKNYLKENEIDELNRIIVMWLDFAEDQARRRKQVFMKEWEEKLDQFLRFNDRNVLSSAGNVSKKNAENHAKKEYKHFEKLRREYEESVAQENYIKQLENSAKEISIQTKDD